MIMIGIQSLSIARAAQDGRIVISLGCIVSVIGVTTDSLPLSFSAGLWGW